MLPKLAGGNLDLELQKKNTAREPSAALSDRDKAVTYNRHFSRIYFSFRIAHLSYVGFVPFGDLLDNIGIWPKIQKLLGK